MGLQQENSMYGIFTVVNILSHKNSTQDVNCWGVLFFKIYDNLNKVFDTRLLTDLREKLKTFKTVLGNILI